MQRVDNVRAKSLSQRLSFEATVTVGAPESTAPLVGAPVATAPVARRLKHAGAGVAHDLVKVAADLPAGGVFEYLYAGGAECAAGL